MRQRGLTSVWMGASFFIGGLVLTGGIVVANPMNTAMADVAAPMVTVNQAPAQVDPAPAPSTTYPVQFAVVFSEPVTGFAVGDVTWSGGSLTPTTYTVTGSGNTYSINVTAASGTGTLIPVLNSSVCVGMATGLGNAASTSTDNTVTVTTGTASLTLSAPAANAYWATGSTHPITWTSSLVPGTAAIEVRLYNYAAGGTYVTITPTPVSGVQAWQGAWNWTVPAGFTAGSQYRVRIVAATGTNGWSPVSPNYFSVGRPALTLNGPALVNLECGATYTELGATASDGYAPPLQVTLDGAVNTSVIGSCTVTYDANDGHGNSAVQISRVVSVTGTAPPVITMAGITPVTVAYGETYSDAGATAMDACAGDLTAAIVTVNPVNTSVPGTYTVTYNVKDGQGNSAAELRRTVVVEGPPSCVQGLPQWTWMKGASTGGQPGVYGTLGTPAAANGPGARHSASTWTDPTGQLWLFGGYNRDYFNDLWKFDPASGNWTWMKGAATNNQHGTYGTMGTPAAANTPGARYDAVQWIDTSGNLWLFGGLGYDSANTGHLSDLWRYEPASGNWTWMKGSPTRNQLGTYGTLGVPAEANAPGGRYRAVSWIDASGALWIFGGYGSASIGSYGNLNDLWKYDPGTGNWTWMKGASTTNAYGIYGTLGTADPANVPGARYDAVQWTDTSGNMWLFGGLGSSMAATQVLNDLWKYSPATGNWTWMKGASTGFQFGIYGTLGISEAVNTPGARQRPVSWADVSGKLWLFGGLGVDAASLNQTLNDLWQYDPATGNWAWMKGASTGDQLGIYGTPGTVDPAGTPGGRWSAVSWAAPSGSLWLFGGFGYDSVGNNGYLNDLWRATEVANGTPPVITLSGANPVTVQCGTSYADAGATASAACGHDLTGGIVVTNPVTVNTPGAYTVRYNVTDGDGNNAAEVTRIVNVVDTTKPVITRLGSDAVTVECHTSYVDAGATAIDACAGDRTSSIVVTSPVDVNVPGTYTVRYNVTDGNGNTAVEVARLVNIVDTPPPDITLVGSAAVTVECHTSYTDAGATAADSCAGDRTASIAVSNPVDVNAPGTYTVRYNVNDGNGNSAEEVTRTVNVADTIKPVITRLGNATVTVQCHTSYTDAGATAADSCAGDLTDSVEVTSRVDVNTPGTYTVTYNVDDGNGNTATEGARTVHVVDTTRPVITLLGTAGVVLDCGQEYADAGAAANDTCWGELAGVIVTAGLPPAGPLGSGSWAISYDVLDGSGNSADTVWRTVMVQDNCTLAVNAVGDTLVHSRIGGRVEMSVVATGAVGEVRYQWRKEGRSQGGKAFETLAGATDATLVIDPVAADSEGLYVCAVSDAVTTVDGPVFTLAPPAEPIPAAGPFGLAAAAVALGIGGMFITRRRRL